jgi:hypothetical protein
MTITRILCCMCSATTSAPPLHPISVSFDAIPAHYRTGCVILDLPRLPAALAVARGACAALHMVAVRPVPALSSSRRNFYSHATAVTWPQLLPRHNSHVLLPLLTTVSSSRCLHCTHTHTTLKPTPPPPHTHTHPPTHTHTHVRMRMGLCRPISPVAYVYLGGFMLWLAYVNKFASICAGFRLFCTTNKAAVPLSALDDRDWSRNFSICV